MAVVLEETALDVDLSEDNQGREDETDMVPTACATLTQLLAQQSVLTERIAEWKEEDF